jgi:gamma-glutamyltranspeptidase/glutathione hydrolase
MKVCTARSVRIILLALAGSLLLGATAGLAQTRQAIIRYDSVHHPVVAAHGMVVSQNELASRVGRDILGQGGNAVDAAVATGFALAVTLPRAGNLGGSGFMLVHVAEESKTYALDYRSMAPLTADAALFRGDGGQVDWDALTHGARAAAVPGTVAGLFEAWQRWGSMPWGELVAPAQALASAGIVVSHDLSFALTEAAQTLGNFGSSAAIYLRPDLAAYRVRERAVVATDYRGYRVVSMPPVSAGGVTLIQMLNMLSEFDLAAIGAGSVQHLHLLAEVMKRAAANRRTWLGDPDFVKIPLAEYISPAIGKAMAGDISLDRMTEVESVRPWPMLPPESHDTTHFSAVDGAGNAVSNTYTLGHSFGGSWVASGTGILFDNQMRNFSYRDEPGHPNALVPKKRMLSTMTPTIVLDAEGEVFLVTGTPGGSYIINVILQIIVNLIDFNMNISEATHRPRIYQGWNRPQLGLEPGFSPDLIRQLEQLGHETRIEQTMGSVQSISRHSGRLHGAADPRRPGAMALGLMAPPPVRAATGLRRD